VLMILYVVVFFFRLAEDLRAGHPMLHSLRKSQEEFAGTSIEKTIKTLADNIEKGSTLFEALEKHPGVFDEGVVALVKGGETAGCLDHVLPVIADYVGGRL